MEELDIVAVDHGWSLMKTPEEIFTAGIKEITTEPALTDNLLLYKGRYYRVGGKRAEVRMTKVLDDRYYLLTLAAIAKELKFRNKKKGNIYLATGVPLSRFGAEKKDFIEYLSKERELSFAFEKEYYSIAVRKVSVFPQCYAAVADKLALFRRFQLVIDIGSWTMDVMPIENMIPDEGACFTQEMGLIPLMREINQECVRKLNGEIAESDIQYIMRTGKSELPRGSRYGKEG